MNPAIIFIRRTWKLGYSLRQFAVFIDGKKVGGVKNGAEAKFEVSPGRHSIYVEVTFSVYKSEPSVLDLRPGQSTSLVCGVSDIFSAYTSPKTYLYLRSEKSSVGVTAEKESASRNARKEQVVVHLENDEERVPTATEEAFIPKGVKIKVKRSRTVEHTVEIDWTITGEARFEAGFKQIVSGSIRGEISQKQGRTATESETLEYEVEIDGDKCSRYQLNWIDIWRKGTAEFRYDDSSLMVPFRYREKSEFNVAPVQGT